MLEPISLDPFALLRGFVAQLEKRIDETAGPLLRSEGFVNGANKAMGSVMAAKKLQQDLTQRCFEVLNVPSRTDVLALADRLQGIEDHLIGMQATLDRLAGGTSRSAVPAPSRTRKPPEPVIAVAPAPRRTRKVRT